MKTKLIKLLRKLEEAEFEYKKEAIDLLLECISSFNIGDKVFYLNNLSIGVGTVSEIIDENTCIVELENKTFDFAGINEMKAYDETKRGLEWNKL